MMAAWVCPNCEGGFPRPRVTGSTTAECPWCRNTLVWHGGLPDDLFGGGE